MSEMLKLTEDKISYSHHLQETLCTTRLPYRQGRKLTAVKVYTINNESNHLLVFGVPALKLRQETKTLFLKFGKLLQFCLSTVHAAETFTETYHATYERIQSARLAKRMLDTKNFYGGSLHICYAPELESVTETYEKIQSRQREVLFRLRNIQKEPDDSKVVVAPQLKQKDLIRATEAKKLYMGDTNTIVLENKGCHLNRRKRKKDNKDILGKEVECSEGSFDRDGAFIADAGTDVAVNMVSLRSSTTPDISDGVEVETVDCTSVDKDTITNINESLNYNNFGNEVIRKVPEKSVNRIKFNFTNKANVT